MSDVSTLRHRLRGEAPGETRYLRAGCGEPVILVHGVGMAASIWAPQIEFLKPRFDVIAYDMLGHGGSSLPPADARLADYSDQLLALLDGLGLEAAGLVGHSMGALVALDFALSHPGRVRGLAALNAVYCRSPEQRSAVEKRAAALLAKGAAASPEATIARWFGAPVPDALAAAAATVRGLLGSADPAGYARTYRVFATSDAAHRDRLPALAMPALFLTGELDANSSPAMSRGMAEAAPRGRAEIVPGERHMMAVTAPEEINRRLAAFLASLDGARERPRPVELSATRSPE